MEVDLNGIANVEVTQATKVLSNLTWITKDRPDRLDIRRCNIIGLKSLVEGRDFSHFSLVQTTIERMEPMNFGVSDLIFSENVVRQIKGQPFEEIEFSESLWGSAWLVIRDNVFEDGSPPWKFHESFDNFLKENEHYNMNGDSLRNNTLNYQCDDIPEDLKQFIRENNKSWKSLEKTMSGQFIKSLSCKGKDGHMVDLEWYKFPMDNNNGTQIQFDADEDSNEIIENPEMTENNDGEIPTQPQPTEPEDVIGPTEEDSNEVNSGAQTLIHDILLIITCLMYFITIHFCTSKLI